MRLLKKASLPVFFIQQHSTAQAVWLPPWGLFQSIGKHRLGIGGMILCAQPKQARNNKELYKGRNKVRFIYLFIYCSSSQGEESSEVGNVFFSWEYHLAKFCFSCATFSVNEMRLVKLCFLLLAKARRKHEVKTDLLLSLWEFRLTLWFAWWWWSVR